MGFLSVPNLARYQFSELELSLISFTGSDSMSTSKGGNKRKRKLARGVGWGQSFKGGNYFKYFHRRGVIIRRRQLIEGWLLLEEIQNASFLKAL